MHKDALRHVIATVIAAVIAMGASFLLVIAGVREATQLVGTTMALVFGVYGPLFLWLSRWAFGGLEGDALRRRLSTSRERSTLVRILYLGGPKSWAFLIATIGLCSVLLLTTTSTDTGRLLVIASIVCVIGTWILLVAVFTVEYMRLWASEEALDFPGDHPLRFEDFLYASVQLSTTFSASDVTLVRTSARRLATVHSIIAFAYSTVIVAVFASLLIQAA